MHLICEIVWSGVWECEIVWSLICEVACVFLLKFHWKIMNLKYWRRNSNLNWNNLKSKITSWYFIFPNNIHNNNFTSLYPCCSLIGKWSTRIKAKSWYTKGTMYRGAVHLVLIIHLELPRSNGLFCYVFDVSDSYSFRFSFNVAFFFMPHRLVDSSRSSAAIEPGEK